MNNADDANDKEKANVCNEMFTNVGKRIFERSYNHNNIRVDNINEQQTLTRENAFRPEPVDTNSHPTIKHL